MTERKRRQHVGSHATYGDGCKCDGCSDAETLYCRVRRARRRELAVIPDYVVHGKPATYGNWGCKCDACKAAKLDADRARAQRPAGTPAHDNRPWSEFDTFIACNENVPLILRAELLKRTEEAVKKRRQRVLKAAPTFDI